MTLIQFVLAFILALALGVTWRRARQGVISWREAVSWSLLWIVAGIVIVLPQTTSAVAQLFGVGRGVDLVIYASVTLLFILVFKLFLSFDRVERQMTDLVRKEALRDLPTEQTHE